MYVCTCVCTCVILFVRRGCGGGWRRSSQRPSKAYAEKDFYVVFFSMIVW